MPAKVVQNRFQIYGVGLKEATENADIASGQPLFRSLTKRTPVRFPADLGESHPFDMTMTEGIYTKFGFVNAIIEKIVEYIWGGGIYVESENEDVKEIIQNWIDNSKFTIIGREWTKDALVKGNGYLELGGEYKSGVQGIKYVDAKNMYVSRNEKGVIVNYKQLIKGIPQDRDFSKNPLTKNMDFLEFVPENIVHFKVNKIGDNAYGYDQIHTSKNALSRNGTCC